MYTLTVVLTAGLRYVFRSVNILTVVLTAGLRESIWVVSANRLRCAKRLCHSVVSRGQVLVNEAYWMVGTTWPLRMAALLGVMSAVNRSVLWRLKNIL